MSGDVLAFLTEAGLVATVAIVAIFAIVRIARDREGK